MNPQRTQGFKSDRRRSSQTRKDALRRARIAKASTSRRLRIWQSAAIGAETAGHPLNAHLTIAWAKFEAGSDVSPDIRARRLWSALRFAAARADVPWLAARGAEYGPRKGQHHHFAFHWSGALTALEDLICVIERHTGARAAWFHPSGRRLGGLRGVVALSHCGSWMVQRSDHHAGGDGVQLARYAAKGQGAAKAAGRHQLSNALSQLAQAGGLE